MLIAVAAEDEKFQAQLATLLSGNGYACVALRAELPDFQSLRSTKPRLLVVEGDGALVCVRALRAQADLRLLPVLCVNPRSGVADTVKVLDAGADDVIARPFQPPVFLARVRTLLRRASWLPEQSAEETATVLRGGSIELRLISRHASIVGRPVQLTRLEFDLLAHLLKHPERAFKRDELLAAVWNYPGSVETRTLDKHVESLRRKIGDCAPLIQTVHGVGYRFSPAPASADARRANAQRR